MGRLALPVPEHSAYAGGRQLTNVLTFLLSKHVGSRDLEDPFNNDAFEEDREKL